MLAEIWSAGEQRRFQRVFSSHALTIRTLTSTIYPRSRGRLCGSANLSRAIPLCCQRKQQQQRNMRTTTHCMEQHLSQVYVSLAVDETGNHGNRAARHNSLEKDDTGSLVWRGIIRENREPSNGTPCSLPFVHFCIHSESIPLSKQLSPNNSSTRTSVTLLCRVSFVTENSTLWMMVITGAGNEETNGGHPDMIVHYGDDRRFSHPPPFFLKISIDNGKLMPLRRDFSFRIFSIRYWSWMTQMKTPNMFCICYTKTSNNNSLLRKKNWRKCDFI